MSGFHLSIADNAGHFRKWHDRKHGGPWASCIWEPCSVTDTQFREAWSNGI